MQPLKYSTTQSIKIYINEYESNFKVVTVNSFWEKIVPRVIGSSPSGEEPIGVLKPWRLKCKWWKTRRHDDHRGSLKIPFRTPRLSSHFSLLFSLEFSSTLVVVSSSFFSSFFPYNTYLIWNINCISYKIITIRSANNDFTFEKQTYTRFLCKFFPKPKNESLLINICKPNTFSCNVDINPFT